MTALFDYLLQASVILALFYAIYFLILRNERLFVEVRIYLVISILLSVLLPFVKIPYTVIVETVQASVQSEIIPMFTGEIEALPIKQNYFTIPNILFAGYLLVVAVLLVNSIIKLGQIYRMVLGKDYTLVEDCKVIVLGKEIPAFTFFGYIVMNREEFTDESRTNILAHEKVHADQKHWIDLLLVELLTILVWFNPIVWLYQIAIKQTHELLADDGVIARGFNIGQYQATLINQIMGTEVLGLANNFNHSITKKRMIMMSNVKSPKNRRYKFLIMIPAVLAILLFNLKIVEVQAQEKKIKEVVNVTTVSGQVFNVANEPIPGVAILVENTTVGTISDMEGKFSLSVATNAQLVFKGEDLEEMIIPVPSIIKHTKKTESGYFTKINMMSSSLMNKDEKSTYKGEQVFAIVEEMPKYPGGEEALKKYINDNVKYPAEAIKNNICGRVFVTFVVNKEGDVDQARVVRGVEASLDAEALRVINKIPKWKPGKQRGQTVNVAYTVPINFDLQDDKEIDEVKVIKEIDGSQLDGVAPKFPGGKDALLKFVDENLVYPQSAKDKSVKGMVSVYCFVKTDGTVERLNALSELGPEFKKEAIRIVKKMPLWTPAYKDGVAVEAKAFIPVVFGVERKDIDKFLIPNKEQNTYKGESTFVIVEDMPKFPGGQSEMQKFISRTVKYPVDAQKKGETGRVFVTFIVNKIGAVDRVRIIRSVSPSIDKEAVRVIESMPKWEPGKMKGKPVSVSYTVPINFELNKKQGAVVVDKAINNTENMMKLKDATDKPVGKWKGEDTYMLVDDMPEYPGGSLKLFEYIVDEISKLDSKYIINKKCFITFLITKTGKADNLKIVKGTGNKKVDKKAMEIIKNMPKWKVGKVNGEPVNVNYTVPVYFSK